MVPARIRAEAWRGVLLTLAVLALVMRIAVPQGFMVASNTLGGAELVICTGSGPLKTAPDAPADKSKSDGACAFAGQGVGAAPEAPPALAAASFVGTVADKPIVRPDLAPGRGLAAPPPPSLGPPLNV